MIPPLAGIFLLIAATIAAPLHARRQNTVRKGLKADPHRLVAVERAAGFDTVAAPVDSVRFSGYEKTLRSTRETVFVTNFAGREIERLIFTVEYFDVHGRLLHKERRNLYGGIPAGETRKMDFPAWDRQGAFYYVGSPRPRVSARPYSVKIVPDTVIYLPQPSTATIR